MEKVINCFKRRPDAVTRLLCFPWAGGGSIHYARWGNVLNSSIEGKTPGGCFIKAAFSLLIHSVCSILTISLVFVNIANVV